ncbi:MULTISPECIES: DUF6029 family protein [Myroides]|uniref:Uncharacterized protein n=1 Tax=Myroides albus TaxID=2562892 RepID=A0A6I3LII6_9FLAO|nr:MULTISPECIES: DUF6029 family protein [Myroides]MTG99449.1 hypothetical protein [Myroides albus]MVX37068.1 hypothetical protein [Myroides sp. LoEW2-1]UVD81142.1 DUF6029 family protein [Myroides albus]
MKRILLFLGIALGVTNSYSQIRVGFENNSQWYIDDKKIKLAPIEAEDRFRSNSYLKVDYDFKNWTFGTQLEGYAPKAMLNYSPDYDKVSIGTIYARYNNVEKGIDVTAGHFYDQFGSGLLFRAWEDKQLGVNNAIFGVNAKYSVDNWGKVTVFGGRQRVGMGFDLSKSFLFGADIGVSIDDLAGWDEHTLSLGASFLGRNFNKNDEYDDLDRFNSGYSFRADYAFKGFYIGAEYVTKASDCLVQNFMIDEGSKYDGNALLINTGFTQKGMSLDVNFRRIENMGIFSEREFLGNDYFKGIMNYVPALTKQYDYSLQNIYVYQAQSNIDLMAGKTGEIGGQFDFYYEFKKGTSLGGAYGMNLTVNGAYWAGLKSEVNFFEGDVSNEFIGFGEKYYRDLGFEVRKKWSKQWSSVFMYLNQFYNAPVLLGKMENINTNIVSAETTYQFLDDKSVRMELQHMWADADNKNWMAGTLEFALNSKWSFFGSDMYNYGNDDSDNKIHYYNFGASFTKGVTRVSAAYGRQRGGLMCVGGVCRYVTEAAGLTIGITTSF